MAKYYMALVPAFLGLMSLVLSLLSGVWCRLVYIPLDADAVDRWVTENPEHSEFAIRPSDLQLGLYFRRDQGLKNTFDSCISYDFSIWSEATAGWRTAFVAIPISCGFSFMCTFCLFISTGCVFPQKAYKFIAYLFVIICAPSQTLLFCVLASNLCKSNPQLAFNQALGAAGNETVIGLDIYKDFCELGTGGHLGISAIIGYILTGFTCYCLGPKKSTNLAEQSPQKSSTSYISSFSQRQPSSLHEKDTSHSFVSEDIERYDTGFITVQTTPSESYEEGSNPATNAIATAPYGGANRAMNSYQFHQQRLHQHRQSEQMYVTMAEQRALRFGAVEQGTRLPQQRNSENMYTTMAEQRALRFGAVGQGAQLPLQRQSENMYMTMAEQRALSSAVGKGARVGAAADADTVHDIPSVIQGGQGNKLMPQSEAAVDARTRANMTPEDVPLTVVSIGLEDDERSVLDVLDETDVESFLIDLDDQDALIEAVAVGSGEGARARADTLLQSLNADNTNYLFENETKSGERLKSDPPTSSYEENSKENHFAHWSESTLDTFASNISDNHIENSNMADNVLHSVEDSYSLQDGTVSLSYVSDNESGLSNEVYEK